jgi:hypothetical protein
MAWSGSWWDAASRNLLGRVFFHVQLLRPLSVEGDADSLGASGLVGLSSTKKWEVVHQQDVPFENVKVLCSQRVRSIADFEEGCRGAHPAYISQKDMLGAYAFKCNLTDKELGLLPGDILVQVRTVLHPKVPHAVRHTNAFLSMMMCILSLYVCVCVCVCVLDLLVKYA